MGAIKRAFHDQICWNVLDPDEQSDVLNPLSASRKADRETLADILTIIASSRGATVEQQEREATPGFCGRCIHMKFTRNGVGAMVDISDIHGGAWVLVHWFNASYPPRDFSSRFNGAVGSGSNGRPHHKATSHPRNWHLLAKMLDAGLCLAASGGAFEEPSAT